MNSWQQVAFDEMQVSARGLQLAARDGWAELVRDLMPWAPGGFIVNAATFDERQAGYTHYEKRRMCRPEDRVPGRPISVPEAMGRAAAFLEGCRKAFCRPVEGFMALEGDGLYKHLHLHGIVWVGGGIRDGDIKLAHDVWFTVKGNGSIKLQYGDALAGDWFVKYTTKHTVKDLSEMYISPGCGRQYYEGVYTL